MGSFEQVLFWCAGFAVNSRRKKIPLNTLVEMYISVVESRCAVLWTWVLRSDPLFDTTKVVGQNIIVNYRPESKVEGQKMSLKKLCSTWQCVDEISKEHVLSFSKSWWTHTNKKIWKYRDHFIFIQCWRIGYDRRFQPRIEIRGSENEFQEILFIFAIRWQNLRRTGTEQFQALMNMYKVENWQMLRTCHLQSKLLDRL